MWAREIMVGRNCPAAVVVIVTSKKGRNLLGCRLGRLQVLACDQPAVDDDL